MPSTEEQPAATLTPIAEGNDEDSEQEAVASRLLRSSSRRFEVVSELDYASLPPIREYFCVLPMSVTDSDQPTPLTTSSPRPQPPPPASPA